MGLAAYLNERAALEAQVTAQLTSVADLKKEQIVTWLNERQADVRLLAVNKLNQEHFTEILTPNIPTPRKLEFAAFLTDNLLELQQSRVGYSELPEVIGVAHLIVGMDETVYPLIRAWPGMGDTGETLLVRSEGDDNAGHYYRELAHGGPGNTAR